MDAQTQRVFDSWAKLLNPESLRSNLIAASMFLAAYETLRASVIDQIRNFFTHGFKKGKPIISDNYGKKVLSLDKSPLRASLLWLKDSSVIDDVDIASVDTIREHRNQLAHDLPKFIATADANINLELLGQIHDLVTKIDRWWVREVEIPCEPDFDGREIQDEDIISGNMLFLHLMIRVVAGEDSQAFWEECQKEAVKRLGKTSKATEPEAVADRPRN